jgi:hypothetical protein
MSKPIGFKNFLESSDEFVEAMTMQQRQKAKMRMKKLAPKIKIAKAKAAKKIASMDVLKLRARKAARNKIVKKLTNDVPKGELSFSRRADIEKRVAKKAGAINKIAKKLLPQIRKAEMSKKRGGGTQK